MHRSTLFSQAPNLRLKIIESYPREVAKEPVEPTSISCESFAEATINWLRYANSPYSQRKNHGIYYADDYVKYFVNHEMDSTSILALAHINYWDLTAPPFLFRAKEDSLPSRALNAFFVGPTFADCSSALQACLYRAIEEMIGTKEFDRIFNPPLTPFLITPTLFFPILSCEKASQHSLEKRVYHGNPLFFLFDKIETKNEEDIQLGDIVYIGGVDSYNAKHLEGYGQGWNLVCVGKNSENENLYLGFGPETFSQPLTYKEIQAVLIKFYNFPPSIETHAKAEKIRNLVLSTNQEEYFLLKVQLDVAQFFEDHKVSEDHPIKGILDIIRFNPKKLQLFLDAQPTPWHSISNEIETSSSVSKEKQIKQVTPITRENKGKSFFNYEVNRPTQDKMLSLAKQFASAVCSKRTSPIGLIMTGMAGIGKSHLSVAVADHAAKQGLNVIFVDDNTICNLYQKFFEEGHNGDVKILEEFKIWLNAADLIVVDDINSKYGIGANFLKKAIQYTMENNKAIMINANKPFYFLKENLPDYIGYDSELANNFVVIQELKGESYRKKWWPEADLYSSSGKLESMQDAIEIMANLNITQGAGIIIEEKEETLEFISQLYLASSPDKNIKIKIVGEPYKDEWVFEMYIHDTDQYDVFIINVNKTSECEQLLNLIPHIHNSGKKLIVVTRDEKNMLSEFNEELNSCTNKENKQRLEDRANRLLLKKLDWPSVEVKAHHLPNIEEEKQSPRCLLS